MTSKIEGISAETELCSYCYKEFTNKNPCMFSDEQGEDLHDLCHYKLLGQRNREIVEKMAEIPDYLPKDICQQALIAALASGEVVLRKDVEEVFGHLKNAINHAAVDLPPESDGRLGVGYSVIDVGIAEGFVNQALAKFTPAPLKGDTK